MRINKFEYIWVVQGNYGYGHGWEDVSAGTYEESASNLKEYRENDNTGVFRRIQRRILNEVMK